MDKIVEYIKKIELENKELKKQNQNLMKQCCSENRTIQQLIVDITDYKDEIEDYKETIQELKGENEKLQEFKEQAEDECSSSAVCAKMIDEIRELEGELEILKEKHQLKCKNMKALKDFAKYKNQLINEWIFEDEYDTLKKLNDDIDNNY